MKTLKFFVAGIPVPQGSKICVNNRPIEANKGLRLWRKEVSAVAHLARQENEFGTLDEPMQVDLTFLFKKPAKPKFELPAVKPDVDKLIRAVFDGLTDAGVWVDDSRVISVMATKFYADEPGVIVEVSTVTKL